MFIYFSKLRLFNSPFLKGLITIIHHEVKPRPNSTSPSERGAVLVEAAIGFVLLVIFLIGMVDVARMVHASIVLSHAADEAARAGAKLPNLTANTLTALHPEIKQRFDAALLSQNVPVSAGYTVTSSCESLGVPGAVSGDALVVRASAQYQSLFSKYLGLPIRASQWAAYIGAEKCAPGATPSPSFSSSSSVSSSSSSSTTSSSSSSSLSSSSTSN